VLLADGAAAGLDDEGERQLLDLGAAVLDAEELCQLRDCLAAVRRGGPPPARPVLTPWGEVAVLATATPARSSRGALTAFSRRVGDNRGRDVDCTAGRGRPCHP
jgi:hypothetical protein